MTHREPSIVHVLGGFRFGGNETLCLQLLHRTPRGFRPVLLNQEPARQESRGMFEKVPGLEIVEIEYDKPHRLRFMRQVTRWLLQERPVGILAYPFGVHVYSALAAKVLPGTRYVVHAGNPPPDEAGKARRGFQKVVWASRLLDTPILSCSRMVHEKLSELGPMPPGSAPVYNGVDCEAVLAAARRGKQKRTKPGPIIGMVARLNVIKDQATLIRAFAHIRARRPTAELWLVGDGETRSELERLRDALGLSASIRLMGERVDVPELLGQLDVFVFSTSIAEGFGIALAEALAAELPVVASDVPACREVLDEGRAGRLVPSGDDIRMAEAIEALLDAPDTARQLARAGAERARALFSAEACAQAYYAEALRGVVGFDPSYAGGLSAAR